MKIRIAGKDLNLQYNENGNMFCVVDDRGRVVDWLCSRYVNADHNQCWLDSRFLAQFEMLGIVKHVEPIQVSSNDSNLFEIILCDIVHPEFNDGGFSSFGDFCRSRLKQQCQYGSRYITGVIPGYPALGAGLRFNNGMGYDGKVRELDASNYHAVRIHRDDMDEFERRYKVYQEE